MILVLIDDLLFRSKISSACKTAGVELAVAGSPEAALERARATRPSAVWLDLDSSRTRPLELVARLAEDPSLAGVPTLGFVSHVRADLIREARAAGIGEVLARGAFAQGLPEIIQRAEAGPPERS